MGYTKTFVEVKESDVYEYIIENIKESLNCSEIKDEDDYYDELHISIDDWVSGSTGEAKDLVDDYGFLKAIRLQEQEYGDLIDLNDDDNKIYMCLAFVIIYQWFRENYSYEKYKEEEEDNDDKWCLSHPPYRCDGGCGKIMGSPNDDECDRICDDCKEEDKTDDESE